MVSSFRPPNIRHRIRSVVSLYNSVRDYPSSIGRVCVIRVCRDTAETNCALFVSMLAKLRKPIHRVNVFRFIVDTTVARTVRSTQTTNVVWLRRLEISRDWHAARVFHDFSASKNRNVLGVFRIYALRVQEQRDRNERTRAISSIN